MIQGHLHPAGRRPRTPASCRCGVSAPEDPELRDLFDDMALTLFDLMDRADAEILIETELKGRSPAQIAARLGCSQAEAARRIRRAQRCFCRMVAQSLSSGRTR